MSKLTHSSRQTKKTSKFQRYWQRAEKLKAKIAEQTTAVETLAERLRTEVFPRECASYEANRELLYRLFDLGRRKTWSQWQHREIEAWIDENMRLCSTAGLVDKGLIEAMTRYDAFRFDVALDESDDRPLDEQLEEVMKKRARASHEEMHGGVDEMIEKMLDEILGPRPDESNSTTEDIALYDEMRSDHYDKLRASFGDASPDADVDAETEEYFDSSSAGDSFDFGDERELPPSQEPSSAAPALDNAMLLRLFRSTAAVLHPDREPDAEKRLEKQSLMSELLLARKAGDVMTVLNLYQEHVGNGDALSEVDEKQLLKALDRQCRLLQQELDHYEPGSFFHEEAYDLYHSARKNTDQAIAEIIESVESRAEAVAKLSKGLRAMKDLKPMLRARYDAREQHYDPLA